MKRFKMKRRKGLKSKAVNEKNENEFVKNGKTDI